MHLKMMPILRLYKPQSSLDGETYCGPTVISVLSGLSYDESIGLIKRVKGDVLPENIRWMKFSDLHDCILYMGFRVEADYLEGETQFQTLESWIAGRNDIGHEMGDDPENDTWLINLTNHFILIQGISLSITTQRT